MVDEHYYAKPQWFWDHRQRYATYDRAGPKVYVGEYAAHDADRRNTLRSALAEAAGCIGFERNGDVVHFASYAPLLARREHTQWIPDMIYFDSTDVFLTPNYHVQQLFGQNSGDRVFDTTIIGGNEATRLVASTVVDSQSGDVILKLVNGDDAPAPLAIHIDGLAENTAFPARKTVLTGPGADSVNDYGKSPAVYPVTSATSVRSDFDCEAPGNSLTIFRISRN
jgi:alpha-L-arabinofuranosidase